MKRIASLLLAVTIVIGATAASAGEGAAVGSVLGATVGALTFRNKAQGAAVGAGVGLLTGLIVDAEKKRLAKERAQRAQQAPIIQRSTLPRRPYRQPPQYTREQYSPQPAQYRSRQSAHNDTKRLVRERRVTTKQPDGSTKVVTTKIYEDPGW